MEPGSWLPGRAVPLKANSLEEISSQLAFEMFSLFGSCCLNSKSCQLWLSPLEAWTNWSLKSPLSNCSSHGASGICRVHWALKQNSCCGMLLQDTYRGLEASGTPWSVLNREANHCFVTSSWDKELQRWKNSSAGLDETTRWVKLCSTHPSHHYHNPACSEESCTCCGHTGVLDFQKWLQPGREKICCNRHRGKSVHLSRKPSGMEGLSLREVSKVDLRSWYLYKLFQWWGSDRGTY